MKKNLFILTVFAALTLFAVSCKKKLEDSLIGTWTNTKTEYSDLDSVSQKIFDSYNNQIDFQKQMLNFQLQSAKNDSAKSSLTKQLNYLDSVQKTLNIDTIKKQITVDNNFGTFVFNKDKTFMLKIKGDSVSGSWNIVGDSLSVTIMQKESKFFIDKYNNNQFTIVDSNSVSKFPFKITYIFEKQK